LVHPIVGVVAKEAPHEKERVPKVTAVLKVRTVSDTVIFSEGLVAGAVYVVTASFMVTSVNGATGLVKTSGIEFPPNAHVAAVGTVHVEVPPSTNTNKYGKAVY